MNRRDFLKTLGVAAAGTTFNPSTGWPAFTETAQQRDPEWHILNRLGYGPRPGDVQALKQKGFETYLKEQFDPAIVAYNQSLLFPLLDKYVTLKMDVSALMTLNILDGIRAIRELDATTVIRSALGKSQLFEVMANFWSEHFSIWHFKDWDGVLKTDDDTNVIRRNTFGKFRDLLYASAKSPAMSFYLDNIESKKEHPNENYARELLELHTLTIGNYTEKDVKEVARCFTGWSFSYRLHSSGGGFAFFSKDHDDGEKVVLGHTIPAGGGVKDGEMVLDILAAHPATAHFIALKLCRRFISDDPPETVVKAAADTFLKSDGDIPTVLTTIFMSPEFASAPPKFKRPFEFVISMMRALAVTIDADKLNSMTYLNRKYARIKAVHPGILDTLQAMGHMPHNHATPEGYTDIAARWETDMLERWNLTQKMVTNVLPAVSYDLDRILQQNGVEPKVPAVLNFYANLLYGRDMTAQEQKVFTTYLDPTTDISATKRPPELLETLALMLGAPAFQWR
ncbi:MAG: DUF1800 family protein [Chloroflexota bacterium]